MKNRALFLFLLLAFALMVGSTQAATAVFNSSGNWTAPAGVTSVTVEAWGGGGAGGGATSNPGKGGGGACAETNTDRSGGAGGSGRVAITYAAAPIVTTDAASLVAATSVTLNGTVSSNDATTTVTFEYGLTAGYGSTVVAAQSPLAANAVNTAVSSAVSGLLCNTLYHYRVKGVNGAGTTNGTDQTFTTSACVPSRTTESATTGRRPVHAPGRRPSGRRG